ncbi:MAG TPA: hypothetical protein VGW78_03455 [Candidatus Babeliales bacterium]|jgi:hypothetical protein|nr:hypothetical protein [Candidatus Babeliales bacterium]
MKMNITPIIRMFFVGYVMNIAMPVIYADTSNPEKKAWSTWVKVGIAGGLAIGSLYAWYCMDVRLQNLLAKATMNAKLKFIEDLKRHAVYNTDGTTRIVSEVNSYKTAPDAEILKNTQVSLDLLINDYNAELLFYRIGSKVCALCSALGMYGLYFLYRNSEKQNNV